MKTVAHELGHQIHFSDEKMFKAFQKLSGWEKLLPADLRRLIPDQIDRDRLRFHLDQDHDRAAADKGFFGNAREFGGWIYRFARYSPRGTYWRHRKDATFISPYAATVPDDDFAESFAYYILEPERLQKECPSKYTFMHVEVFTEYRHDEAAGGSQGEGRRAEQGVLGTVGRLWHPDRLRLGGATVEVS